MANKPVVDLCCAFCPAEIKPVIELPEGWALRHDEVPGCDGGAFCPEHSGAASFLEAQCPGCVGGWPECRLFRSITTPEDPLEEIDFARMREGRCPRRVNGTSSFVPGMGFQVIDLSDPATPEAGAAMETAIRDYLHAYDQ